MVNVSQIVVYITLRYPLRFFLKGSTKGVENISLLRKNKPTIIVANHPSKLDPFLFALVPINFFRILYPYYLPTTELYFNKLWLKPLLVLGGSYSIKQQGWNIDNLLGDTVKILCKGKNILIFPEGRITAHINQYPPRVGIIHLASKTGAQILPLYIRGVENLTFYDFFSRKRKVDLIFGKPFVLENLGVKNYRSKTRDIMNSVYNLR